MLYNGAMKPGSVSHADTGGHVHPWEHVVYVLSGEGIINCGGKDYKVVEKRRVSLPNEIDRIFRCSNPECVTNSNEHIESIMDVLDKEKLVLKCRYCNRVLDVNQLKYS